MTFRKLHKDCRGLGIWVVTGPSIADPYGDFCHTIHVLIYHYEWTFYIPYRP